MSTPFVLSTPIQFHKPAKSIQLSGECRGILTSPDTLEYLRFLVLYLDEDENVVSNEWVGFTEVESREWGDDDSVLLTMIANKLGLTLVE